MIIVLGFKLVVMVWCVSWSVVVVLVLLVMVLIVNSLTGHGWYEEVRSVGDL